MKQLRLFFTDRNTKYGVIFILLFLLLCGIYQYHLILFFRPQGFHQWRQTIGLSIALNYYSNGMNFFLPEVNHLLADGGKTGYAVAECPLLYYLYAVLWKIFGVREFIPRLISLLLVFGGLFSVYKIAAKRLGIFWSMLLPLFIFTSPVAAYYSISFLPDSSAFGIALISLYCFDRFRSTQENKWMYLFFALSLLAGLLKTTSAMFFAAVFVVFLLEKTKIVSFDKKIFKGGYKEFILFFVALAGIASWYLWAAHYNEIHDAHISDSRILPIWSLTKDEILTVIRDVYEINWYQFFCPQTSFLFIFLTAGIFFLKKNSDSFLWLLSLLLVVGAIIYILLWFAVWGRHDYYMFPLFLSLIVPLITFWDYLKKNFPSLHESRALKILVFIFWGYNVWYCSNNVRLRNGIGAGELVLTSTNLEKGFWDWYSWDHNTRRKAYETIESYNREIGIMQNDLVISLPDESVCITLYLMNQRGWNEYGDFRFENPGIKNKIDLGAKYLFVGDSTLLTHPNIQPFTQHKIGQYENISVYDLRAYK
ncbi:MAG: glycosyltransferase family 39 protein [Bacteroidetes bacterium]|nr:glycosyltransferase family 39 protein [Bacteroidota bacterium]